MTSCGESDICSCVSTGLSIAKEIKAADGDDDKIAKIRKKYKPKFEKCDKLMKEKPEKELEEEAKKCPSFKELEKLRDEM